jgi:hypothetical protein
MSRTAAARQALADRATKHYFPAAAALTVLGSRYFEHDARAWSHVSLDGSSIRWDAILADGTWSSGERALLEVGQALWDSQGTVDLAYVFTCLDDPALQVVVDAITALRAGAPIPLATTPARVS